MSDIRLVIFDCDGVLVDSEILGITIEKELLAHAGYDISIPMLTERFSGMSWQDILTIIEAESGLSLMSKLLDKTETELDIRLPKEVEAVDGVRAALETLQFPKCVCSNTKMPGWTQCWRGLAYAISSVPTSFQRKTSARGDRSRSRTFSCSERRRWALSRCTPSSLRILFTAFRRHVRRACVL